MKEECILGGNQVEGRLPQEQEAPDQSQGEAADGTKSVIKAADHTGQ